MYSTVQVSVVPVTGQNPAVDQMCDSPRAMTTTQG